jgi:hypothetical protein
LSLAGSLLFGIAWLWSQKVPGGGVNDGAEEHRTDGPDPLALLRELTGGQGSQGSSWESGIDAASNLLRQWIRLQNPAVSSSHTVPEIEALFRVNGEDGSVRLLQTADSIRFGVKPIPEREVSEFWARLDTWVAATGGPDA